MKIGTIANIISIIGFILSLINLYLTNRVEKKLLKQKLDIRFKSEFDALSSAFKTLLDHFNANEINLIILSYLRENTYKLFVFSQKCKWNKKNINTINNLLRLTDQYIEILGREENDKVIYADMLKALNQVTSILSEEGLYYDL